MTMTITNNQNAPKKSVVYYERITEQVNNDGTIETSNMVTKQSRGIEPQEEYIKVSRYLNTIFAYHNIPLSLVPISLLIAQRMGFKDNVVILLKSQKQEIATMLDTSVARVEQLISKLRKHDIIRPTNDRGIYVVNWFLFSTGSNSEIRMQQAKFDFEANKITVINESKNKITGETVRKAVYNFDPIKNKQIPGQMTLDDFAQEINVSK